MYPVLKTRTLFQRAPIKWGHIIHLGFLPINGATNVWSPPWNFYKKLFYPNYNIILSVNKYSWKRGKFTSWVHLWQFIHSFIPSSLFICLRLHLLYSLYNQLWATWSVPLNVYSPSAIIAFSLLNSILMARFLKHSFAQTCLKQTDNGKLHQFNYWNESTLHTWAGERAMRRRGS